MIKSLLTSGVHWMSRVLLFHKMWTILIRKWHRFWVRRGVGAQLAGYWHRSGSYEFVHQSNKRFTFRCTINVYTFTECVYYGDRDSIEHSLIECMFTRLFTQKVLNWFNQVNACQISPTTDETLFGITTSSHDTTIIRKFNYTALFMRYYIYSVKLNSLAISFQDFISKLLIKYKLENLP